MKHVVTGVPGRIAAALLGLWMLAAQSAAVDPLLSGMAKFACVHGKPYRVLNTLVDAAVDARRSQFVLFNVTRWLPVLPEAEARSVLARLTPANVKRSMQRVIVSRSDYALMEKILAEREPNGQRTSSSDVPDGGVRLEVAARMLRRPWLLPRTAANTVVDDDSLRKRIRLQSFYVRWV